jgi:GH43 family beta-xylosidase
MKFKFDVEGRHQPDPYIFEDNGMYYLYVTGGPGVEAYECESLDGVWRFKGTVCEFENCRDYWAPSIIKYEGTYYIYVSCSEGNSFEHMMVMSSKSPLGPFENRKELYNRFSIDSHIVQTPAGLFLFYAEDNKEGDKIGTRLFVDRILDPYTPANICREILTPDFDEEIFQRNRFGDGKDWYTLEGAFWFREGDWQYVMYSGGCFEDDTYHIGYTAAKTGETDLTKIDFVKHTVDGRFAPVLIKNEWEEGTGHHSVIKWKGDYYAIYHGRDYAPGGNYVAKTGKNYREERTARVCRLHVKDGIITAERYENKL